MSLKQTVKCCHIAINCTVCGAPTVLQIKAYFLMSSVFFLLWWVCSALRPSTGFCKKPLGCCDSGRQDGTKAELDWIWVVLRHHAISHPALLSWAMGGVKITVACFLHAFLHSLTHLRSLFSQRLYSETGAKLNWNQQLSQIHCNTSGY